MYLDNAEAQVLQQLAEQTLSTATLGKPRNVDAGEPLGTGSPGELLLVLEGTGRFIDSEKTFGQFTIECQQAPFLVGALQLLDGPSETCVAASPCRVLDLGSDPIPAPLQQEVRRLLASRICSHEYPLLARLGGDSVSPTSLERCMAEWRLVSPKTLEHHNLIVHADSAREGLVYGTPLDRTELLSNSALAIPHRLLGHQPSARLPAAENRTTNAEPSPASRAVLEEVHSPDRPEGLEPEPSKHGFRWFRPRNRQGPYASLLRSLTDHFDIPIRRETIVRAGSLLDALPAIGLETRLLRVADQLGINATVIILRSARDIQRLPLPCLWWSPENTPKLLIAINGRRLELIDPGAGITSVPFEQAQEWLMDQPLLVALGIGRHTPRNSFGLPWLLPYLSRYRLELFEVFLASFLTQLFALANPLLFQQIIDRVIGQGADGALFGLTVLMVIFMVLELIFSSLRTFQFAEISNRIDISLGSAIVSRMLRLNMRFLQSRPVGELSSRINELDTVRRFITGTALTVVLDAIFSLLYFGVMFVYSATLAGIILGSVPLLISSILGLAPVTESLLRQKAEAQTRTQALTVELLNGIETIKVQNSEVIAKQRWEERQLETINKSFRTTVTSTAGSSGIQLINRITGILVITIGASQVLSNEMTLGELIAFRIISGYVTQPIIRLAACWQSFQEASLSLENIADVVNQPLETKDDEVNNIPMPPLRGKINIEEASFSYGAEQTQQLSAISLEIPEASFVGLVGQSGCGKSTLLKMIARLYSPTQGRVMIDGLDIEKVELYSLRHQIGYVPQDCLLFEGTIFANIAGADPEADSREVLEAARLACAHDFIMEMPAGYTSMIGEKGAGLSGGQRQRIALARMLLQKPRLIILDEATSALDVDTEQRVLNNILESARDASILMTTHRLSTLKQADKIVVMHKGRIDSQGSHNELMAEKGRYFALYQQHVSTS
jgi:ATP-binding cassette subfamily B protein